MPKKKKKKSAPKKSKTKTKRAKIDPSERGAARRCSECGKLGHNQRSHRPGGKLAA